MEEEFDLLILQVIEEDRLSVSKDRFAQLVRNSDLKDAQKGATPKKH